MDWSPPVAPLPPDDAIEPSTNGFAIASLVLGIVWFLGIGSILAVVFGGIARQRITASNGRERGLGMANAGIVLGVLGIMSTVVFAILLFFAMIDQLNTG